MIKIWLKHRLFDFAIHNTMDSLIKIFTIENRVFVNQLKKSDVGKQLCKMGGRKDVLSVNDRIQTVSDETLIVTGLKLVDANYAALHMDSGNARTANAEPPTPFFYEVTYHSDYGNDVGPSGVVYVPLAKHQWVIFL